MNVALIGYGKMGQLVEKTIEKENDMKIVHIVEMDDFSGLNNCKEHVDVIVDFSHPNNLEQLSAYVRKNHTPVVIGTTGFNETQIKEIHHLKEYAPVVFTANFSLGITVFGRVLKQIAPVLKDSFDIEIVEAHHNQKVDAPSGTAKLLLNCCNPDKEFEEVFQRPLVGKRGKEIGVHAIRGGNVAGDHTVMFLGEDETFEITHKAGSKQIFVNGAVHACKFIVDKPNGLYTMEDILFGN